jgi:hypothetical protein
MPWEIDEKHITPEVIKKHGTPLIKKKDIEVALNSETLLAPDSAKADATHYQRLGFQCICKEDFHPMNEDWRAKLVLSALGEKFLYCCETMDCFIFFQVKAKWIVNHYTSPLWFVHGKLFREHSKEILKKHKNYNDIKVHLNL